jgi:hypothetical protein
MKVKSQPGRTNDRRKEALARKAAQLEKINTGEVETTPEKAQALVEEITVLNDRIVTDEVAKSTKNKRDRRMQGKRRLNQ